jgi:hypothetical protein
MLYEEDKAVQIHTELISASDDDCKYATNSRMRKGPSPALSISAVSAENTRSHAPSGRKTHYLA